MKKSLITKKMIEKSMKKLMLTHDFEHVTVSNIMAEAGIRRQTFYNYFADRKELVSSIFEDELTEILSDNFSYYSWKQELTILFRYLEENMDFYYKVTIMGFPIENILYSQCYLLLEKMSLDMEKMQKYCWNAQDKKFLYQYNSYALSAMIKDSFFTKKALSESTAALILNLETQTNAFLTKQKHPSVPEVTPTKADL